MKRNPCTLRCYGRPEDDYMIGVCIDLDLIVRGSTIAEVKKELALSIQSYLDALNKDNMNDLFLRKSPFHVMVDYYRVVLILRVAKLFHQYRKNIQAFQENVIPQSLAVGSIG